MTTIDRRAALAVCAAATDTDDARMLLEALGIWPPTLQYSNAIILRTTAPRIFHLDTEHTTTTRTAPTYPLCGTTAAYRRHLKLTETPCTDCKAAAAAYRMERKRSNQP